MANANVQTAPPAAGLELQNVQVANRVPHDYLRVIQADANDYGTLDRLLMNVGETDGAILRKLAEKIAPTLFWKLVNETFLFQVQSIYVGVLLQEIPNLGTDLEAQRSTVPVPVEFLISRFDPLLTQAFHNPAILGTRTDLLVTTQRFKASGPGMETLVIKYRHTKAGLVGCVVFLALASVAVGCVVGFLTKRADLGVGVSGGIGTLLTIVEAVMFWQSR